MIHLGKIIVGSLGLVLVAVVALNTGPCWMSRVPFTELSSLQTESQHLDSANEEVSQRVMAVEALARTLAEGQASLTEVARDFLAMHENQPFFHEQHQISFPGRTLLESAARDVANRANLMADPAKREQLIQRLTAEFQAAFPGAEPLEFEPIPAPTPHPPIDPRSPLPPKVFPRPTLHPPAAVTD